MDKSNETNVARGMEFTLEAQRTLGRDLGIPLHMEVPIGIGDPPKSHRFDLGNKDHEVAIECKAFTWTSSGNIPSAKITTAREALLYLQWLPARWTKVLAMLRSYRSTHHESLAAYFARLNAHLLGQVTVVEVHDGETRVCCGPVAPVAPSGQRGVRSILSSTARMSRSGCSWSHSSSSSCLGWPKTIR